MAVETDVRLGSFEESLEELGVTWTRTTTGEFADAVREAVAEPAVGAPLPFAELSLSGTGVTLRPTPAQLRAAETGVTAARFGIAEYGTLAIQSRPGGDEPVSLYPERHVAILRECDLVADLPAAVDRLGEEFAAGHDSTVFATGISATGDMGDFVEGVHGPLEVHVIVVDTGAEEEVRA
ncbi:MAG: LUD domain-containing protein [Salinirussus sp.]